MNQPMIFRFLGPIDGDQDLDLGDLGGVVQWNAPSDTRWTSGTACGSGIELGQWYERNMGVFENVVYPKKPNG